MENVSEPGLKCACGEKLVPVGPPPGVIYDRATCMSHSVMLCETDESRIRRMRSRGVLID